MTCGWRGCRRDATWVHRGDNGRRDQRRTMCEAVSCETHRDQVRHAVAQAGPVVSRRVADNPQPALFDQEGPTE